MTSDDARPEVSAAGDRSAPDRPARPGDLQRLALAARGPDPSARRGLARAVHDVARRYCRARLGPSAPSPDAGPGYAAADEVALDVTRGVLRDLQRGGGPATRTPVEALVYRRMTAAVSAAQAPRTAPAGWPGEVLVLRAVVGLSAEQVARALGSSADAVREQQHRDLARLRATV